MRYKIKIKAAICLLFSLLAVSGCASSENTALNAARDYLLERDIVISENSYYTNVYQHKDALNRLNAYVRNIRGQGSVYFDNKTGRHDFAVDENADYTLVSLGQIEKEDFSFSEWNLVSEVSAEIYYSQNDMSEPVLSYIRVRNELDESDNAILVYLPIDASVDEIRDVISASK